MFPTDFGLEAEFTFQTEAEALPDELPFHILLLGNWSGDNFDDSVSKPIEIDRDNFDEVIAKLNVRADISVGDERNNLSLAFNELDDFHPDNLYENVSLFSDLRNLRHRLLNEDTYNAAAREIRSWFGSDAISEIDDHEQQKQIPNINSENLLDDILSKSAAENSLQSADFTHLDKFLSSIVKPFIVQTDENEQAQLLKILDDVTSDLMRAILHHPKFQEIESAWRAVHLLVRRVETSIDLKIFLFDISKDNLASNLKNNKTLAESDLYKFLVENTINSPGNVPYAIVCGNYSFSPNIDDIAALIRISQISEIANAPFISHISPEIFGISSAKDLSKWHISDESNEGKFWNTLRISPGAGFLSFAMPRFLARVPYGKDSEPIESFFFEELIDYSEPDNYLWANPSFICALLFADTFRKYGWKMNLNFQHNVSNLPTFIFVEEDVAKMKPCAEFPMSDSILQKLLDEGLIALISYKNTDRIQIGRFQSISKTDNSIRGRWF